MNKSGDRKLQILQALAGLLERSHGEKITTAALAKHLSLSEAALYRHFASKAQMFDGLIDFIESSIFGLINRIGEREENGLLQVEAVTTMLLHFAERNPGMTRVLIGDALLNENAGLQRRMSQFYDRLELAIRQCFRLAESQGFIEKEKAALYALVLVGFVTGRWHRYARSGFTVRLSDEVAEQIRLLLP
ncbi:MAG: nucleoid occlusion factor SlmA [Burkholderiaceae bacterium]|jgi:TetR/AcrR family transcriptional regulator|nr:nucleoid occlusion factor SlmA [Burkholderiaceae bacterium]